MVLGDRPSGVTARRMGAAVLTSTAPAFLGACALSAAADYAAATGMLPGMSLSHLSHHETGSIEAGLICCSCDWSEVPFQKGGVEVTFVF